MKRFGLYFALLFSLSVFSQESQGIKPGITINGYSCLIQNLVYSCVPRMCDSVVIEAGDSIEFCTFQAIELNQDTAYWLRWQFTGCTNLPDTILHAYPTQTPLCHSPRWDTAGTFMVEVFYNGDLTAYPNCDCYQQGPSHWFIKVVVLPDPNGVEEETQSTLLLFPNPSNGIFTLHPDAQGSEIVVYDATGRAVLRTRENQIDLSSFGKGIYEAVISYECEVRTMTLMVE